MGQHLLGRRHLWGIGSFSRRLLLIAAAAVLIAWLAMPVPGVLYLVATLLISHKVIGDIGAFTEESPRKVDWFSILVIAILAIWIAMAIPAADAKPISYPCIESICVSRPLA